MIIDYSTFRPTPGQIKAEGITAAGRYLGWDCQPGYQCIGKNLTPGELQVLHGEGVSVFLSFEYAADAALSGAEQGTKNAGLAALQLRDLSAPDGLTVYFAVDFDIADYAPNPATRG